MTVSVLDLLRKRRDARTADASAVYRGMLHRIANGEELAEADVAKLDAAADALGKSPADVEADVALIGQYAAAIKAGEAADEAQAAHNRAKAAQTELTGERVRLLAELGQREQQAQADFITTLGAVGAARRAAGEAERLRAERPDLFNE